MTLMLNINTSIAVLAFTLPNTFAVAESVRVLNWEEYLAPAVISAFEQETGHSVEQFYLDNEQQRDTMLFSGRGGNFDLVMIDSQALKTDGEKTYFVDIPIHKIANSSQLSPASHLACGRKGMPYAWGTLSIAYRASANPQGIDSWQALFDIAPGNQQKTIMLKDSINSTGLSLIALGLPPYSEDKDDLKQAYALLKKQRVHLHSYGYGLSYAIDLQAASDITMAVAYSGDTKHFIKATGQQDWRYTIPREGTIIWTDCLAMPHRDSPIKTATIEFLNFISRPDIALLNAETIGLATPNLGALRIARDDYKNDRELFPSPAILAKSHHVKTLSNEQLKIRSRILQKLIHND